MYSFKWLCQKMQDRSVVQLHPYVSCGDNRVYTGTINGICLEDGSGRNWLVTIGLTGGGAKTIFVKAE